MLDQDTIITPLRDDSGQVTNYVSSSHDVTREMELEAQLRHSQKMESIGRLAGGVAHDFNNILTGISGYTQLLLDQVRDNPALAADLSQISNLSDRAAGLTRQLLAFSRRQPVEPIVLNINALVENTSKMLRRLIGENIEFKLALAPGLANILGDPGQIEQVLMNLAVNARDAMPNGGMLTIETANVMLDQEYIDAHIGVKPGAHVMIAVTDTGCGMDKATQERIFEPFFTTKEIGKGTGLGLATVYGILKDHGGNVWVYSEPGKGTTFKIYLPLVDTKAGEMKATPKDELQPQGTETILVVDDEPTVRLLAQRILEKQGYQVIAAGCPSEAQKLFAQHQHEIALVLTDMLMPEMNGEQLAERLRVVKPDLKVVYMSGYADIAVVRHDVVGEDSFHMEKPFTPAVLAHKVREVLDKD